jgi:hypothetical protein
MSNSNKYAFDIDVSADSYSGEQALPYVGAATFGAETIAKGRARLIEGVTGKAVVSGLTVADPIVAASCSTTDGANVTLTEQVATLSDLMVSEQICRKTIFPTYIAAQNRMNRDGDLPPSFSDFLLLHLAQRAGDHLETLMWAGDSGSVFGTGFLSNDGVVDEAGIDASACKDFVEADISANGSTVANIDDALTAVMTRVYSQVPEITDKPGFGIYMSYAKYGLYLQHLAAQGYDNRYQGADLRTATFMGFPVYPCAGIPSSAEVFVATYPDNLVVATNNFTADAEASLIPRYKYDGSDNVQATMRFAVGVQTAVATDGVVGFNFTP